jgi:hypothetical protein
MSDAEVEVELVSMPDKPMPARTSNPVAKKKQAIRVRTELELLAEISGKLDRLVAVLAAGQLKDRDQQVEVLALAGCDSRFIGSFVDLAPSRVRNLDGWRKAHVQPADVPQ